MPCLGTLAKLHPSSTSASPELTERALATLQADDKENEKFKHRCSVMSDDDEDDATFDAELSDFGDRYGMWRT